MGASREDTGLLAIISIFHLFIRKGKWLVVVSAETLAESGICVEGELQFQGWNANNLPRKAGILKK